MTITLSLTIPADHPTGAGHFPGNPIIPGALLLAEVLRCIERAQGATFHSCNVRNAKFLAPVRPGDRVQIEVGRSAQGALEFQCTVAGNRVLAGAVVAHA